MKHMIITLLGLLTGYTLAADYWEPKSTLKKNLNMYTSPTSTSPVVERIPKGTMLIQMEYETSNTAWIYTTYNGSNGFVYKGSVRPFQVDLNPLEKLIFSGVRLARDADDNIFIYFSGSCYVFRQQHIRELPENDPVNMVEYLNKRGGFGSLDEASKAKCASD